MAADSGPLPQCGAGATLTKKPAASQKKAPRTTKPAKRKLHPAKKPDKASKGALGDEFDEFALAAMADGKEWTAAKLKEEAIKLGDTGVAQGTDLRSLIVRLLALLKRGKIVGRGNGVFVIADGRVGEPSGAVIHPFKATA